MIRAARLIDGKGGPPLERGAVLLEGDTIRAVGTEEAVVPPEGAPVAEFNYEDKSVLPGLVDCHVHLIGIGDGRMGDELAKLPDEILAVQAAPQRQDPPLLRRYHGAGCRRQEPDHLHAAQGR